MGTRLPLTSVVRNLPEMVPFVGPETFERRQGRALRVRLGANESVFGISPVAAEAMSAAAAKAWMYNDPEAYDLTEALAQAHGVPQTHVQVGAGIDELLGLLVRVFADAGEPVVMSDGSYPTFAYHVVGHGARLVGVDYQNDHVDLAALAARARTEQARLVYMANPDNPMGSWCAARQIEHFVDAVGEDCIVILDEAYADFAPTEAIVPVLPLRPNLVRTRTFSKAHGLAGFRVGYGFAHNILIENLLKVKLPFEPSWPAQVAAVAALDDENYIQNTTASCREGMENMEMVFKELELDYIPSSANFLTLVFENEEEAASFCDTMLHNGIILRHLRGWGHPECIRVTVGTEEENEYLIKCISKVLFPA